MRTEILKVGGMTCGGCVSTVTNALRSVHGVNDVAVSLEAGEACIEFDEKLTSAERLRSAVERTGYEIANTTGAEHEKGRGCCCG